MSDTYKTISLSTEGIYKEKGSKFLSFALPVNTTDEVKEFIKTFKKDYYDARHVCYAYMLGADRKEWRANDDGEPSGTAGRPILGQINASDLTNTLIVVIRYFGGIKLGVSGLISAYRAAAKDAIDKATAVTRIINEIYELEFSYVAMNDVMRIIKEESCTILSSEFELQNKITIMARKKFSNQVYAKLQKVNSLTVKYLRTI